MSTARDLKAIVAEARPLIESWLDIAEQMSGLREAATAKGLDWSQVKALVKAQVQDDRDGTGEGKRVRRIVERADFASAYADMLGLSDRANLNEKNISQDRYLEVARMVGADEPLPHQDPDTGGIADDPEPVEHGGEVEGHEIAEVCAEGSEPKALRSGAAESRADREEMPAIATPEGQGQTAAFEYPELPEFLDRRSNATAPP